VLTWALPANNGTGWSTLVLRRLSLHSHRVCWWLKPAEVKGEGLAAVLVKVTADTHQRISLQSSTHQVQHVAHSTTP
jgi:hypothetical protein